MSTWQGGNHEMDENDGGLLLMPLSEVELGPSGIDLGRAMADGRRRIRRRRMTAGVAATAAVTAVALVGAFVVTDRSASHKPPASPGVGGSPSASASASGCSVEHLEADGTAAWTLESPTEVYLGGSDPTGKYIIGSVSERTEKPDGVHPTIWTSGKRTTVAGPPGRVLHLSDITSKGVAVGDLQHTKKSSEPNTAVVVRDGQVTKLLGTRAEASAMAINDAGVIVGFATASWIDDDSNAVPVKWASSTAKPVELPLPAGYSGGEAIDVDEDGTIVGRVDNGRNTPRAETEGRPYLWSPDGVGRFLQPASGADFATPSTQGVRIRNGWVVGYNSVWNLRTGEVRNFSVDLHNRLMLLDITNSGAMLTEGALLRPGATTLAGPGTALPALAAPPGEGNATGVTASHVSADGKVIIGVSTTMQKDPDGGIKVLKWYPAVWRCH